MAVTIIEAGMDYLTATVTPKMASYRDFDDAAQSWFADAVQVGLNVKDATSKGYNGLRLEGTFYGKREDSIIWETSGALSNEVARYLGERGVVPRVTRADFQVTHESGEVSETWAREKLQAAESRAASLGHSTKQTVGSFRNFGGDTGFTLGRRGGKCYYRSYLAGAKHKGRYSLSAIRDESEFRSDRAMTMFYEFQQTENKAGYSLGVVRSHMERNHLYEPWHEESGLVELPPLNYSASEERSLLWIENHVCPVIERLANGPYRARLVAALNVALKYDVQEVRQSRTLEAG